MGGHDASCSGSHQEPYKVPDYRIYKVENCPELMATQRALEAHGLKDPWLRNEVWRYEPKVWGTELSRAKLFFLRGARLGFGAFVVTAVVGAVYDRLFPDKHHNHGEENE